jgi:flagellar motor switch protein FliG
MARPADAYRKEQNAGKKRADQPSDTARQGDARKGGAQRGSRGDPDVRGFIKETSRDNGYRKAAQFLMLLGKDEAVRVLKHMSADEVEGITREIARTQHIEEKEAAKILEEFGYISETRDLIAQGGIEKAKEMLVAAVGAEKAEKILVRVRKEMAPPPFSFMQDIDVHQAITLVREESVPVATLILAHLEPKLEARILQSLSPEIQREIVPRIARSLKVDAEIIRKAEETLRSKVREAAEPMAQEVNGTSALTEILRYMDPAREQAILADLEPNTANLIKKKLTTIDVVFQLPDKDLQKVMRDYADRELALVLRGASEMVQKRMCSAISERRRELINVEEGMLDQVRKADLDRAQQDFLEYVQLLEQKGEIVILREREQFV